VGPGINKDSLTKAITRITNDRTHFPQRYQKVFGENLKSFKSFKVYKVRNFFCSGPRSEMAHGPGPWAIFIIAFHSTILRFHNKEKMGGPIRKPLIWLKK
jgi:hypothetical protein